ncbi:MAG: hypothetical protein D6690_16135 [Nitrospirae bacterium]|nr:MAG: hypothetical protein D6690_16135 [Nitrospirota bacterium]
MPKVITAKRLESEVEKAQDYVRTHIVFPSSILGLAGMLVGLIGLLAQLISGSYGIETFAYSSALLVMGIVVGWAQTRYHQFLLRTFPAYFASRMKTATQRSLHKAKKIPDVTIEHRGKALIPLWYLLGITLFLGASIWSVSTEALAVVPGFALPWAGFFWAKMFFWKGIVLPPSKKDKK